MADYWGRRPDRVSPASQSNSTPAPYLVEAPISKLPDEVLDHTMAYVAEPYRIDNCPWSCFRSLETSRASFEPGTYYRAKKDLENAMRSSTLLAAHASRYLYRNVVIQDHSRMLSFLRTLVSNPATRKHIQHLELSSEIEFWNPSMQPFVKGDEALIYATDMDDFPWAERLRENWLSVCGHHNWRRRPNWPEQAAQSPARSNEVVILVILAILHFAQNLRSIRLMLPSTHKFESQVEEHPVHRLLEEIGRFRHSFTLCPLVHELFLRQDTKPISPQLDNLHTLLNLGKITKLNLRHITLDPPIFQSIPSSDGSSVLENLQELTLHTSFGKGQAGLVVLFKILEKTKLRSLRVKDLFDYSPWNDGQLVKMHPVRTWNEILAGQSKTLETFEIMSMGEMSAVADHTQLKVLFGDEMKLVCLSEMENLTTLSVPIRVLLGDFREQRPRQLIDSDQAYNDTIEAIPKVQLPPNLKTLYLLDWHHTPRREHPCDSCINLACILERLMEHLRSRVLSSLRDVHIEQERCGFLGESQPLLELMVEYAGLRDGVRFRYEGLADTRRGYNTAKTTRRHIVFSF